MQDTLSGLFETQAARSPDAVAVSCKDRHLTYRQLDELAGRLACYLRQSGVGPDVAVGLCLDRSLEMVTGILGTLKAGGTYVPIDPNYPPERMQYMLEDSGAKILLSMKDIQKRLPRLTVATICLDSDWNEIAAGADNPKPAAA